MAQPYDEYGSKFYIDCIHYLKAKGYDKVPGYKTQGTNKPLSHRTAAAAYTLKMFSDWKGLHVRGDERLTEEEKRWRALFLPLFVSEKRKASEAAAPDNVVSKKRKASDVV